MKHTIASFVLSLFAVLLLATSTAHAVSLSGSSAEEAKVEEVKPTDPLGRDTPRGSVAGFLKAVTKEDYVDAAQYLDVSKLPRANRDKSDAIAMDLQQLLNRYGWLTPDVALSADPAGKLEDGFDENIDSIGGIKKNGATIEVLLQRIESKDGLQIWVVDADFVKRIPALASTMEETILDKVLVGELQDFKIKGAGIGHWLAMLALYVVAYLLSTILVRLLISGVKRCMAKRNSSSSEKHFISKFRVPLQLYSMVWIAYLGANYLKVDLIVRHAFMPIGIVISWIAVGLFFWRLADLGVMAYERQMAARERYNMTSVLAFVRRALKFISVMVIFILILSSFGVDVSAGLAALGIGGIALALGAQKTLENFIGSLSIIADQPLFVGDFCKIGDVSGTVEDIGMRSTRLRTNDRTLVTIPNGDLSTQRIENFARRSRFLLNRTMVLRYDSTSEKIRLFITKCEDIFKAQPKIVQEGVMVRFLGFFETGYQIQLWANVETRDFNEFLKIQAEVSLQIIDAAWECGLYFAIPSQTFLPAKDQVGGQVLVTTQNKESSKGDAPASSTV